MTFRTTKGNSTDKQGEMAQKHTNTRMQEKPNNFGLKYSNQEKVTKS